MAYCKSCGAYIPDGLTACLACGYDETAARAGAAAQKQTAPKTEKQDDAREMLERHRKLQQEKNRQWAEKEKERRDQQRENRRWAQEEYAKRQAEREVEAEQKKQEAEKRRREEETSRASEASGTSTGTGNRALAALSYLDVLFALPFFLTPNDAYAKYHAKQGIRLFLFTLVTRILKYFTAFGWIFTLMHLYFIYKGMTNALNGKKEPLPYIGTLGEN